MKTLSWAAQSGAGAAPPPLPALPATPPAPAPPAAAPPVAKVPAVEDVPENPLPAPPVPALPPAPAPPGAGASAGALLQPCAAADAEPSAHVKNALRSMRVVKSIDVELPTTKNSARFFFGSAARIQTETT